MSEPQSIELTINHASGLHMRPATLFVQTAAKFQSKITVKNLDREKSPAGDAKSMFTIMMLGVKQGHRVHVEAVGDDAEQALAALKELVDTNFAEFDEH
ncbi:MAG: HPr family phosphocarrier protein [Herpetosiphon sp.]|nr:HPr family phosphocarrier protein [Herpetosiphon sp.]